MGGLTISGLISRLQVLAKFYGDDLPIVTPDVTPGVYRGVSVSEVVSLRSLADGGFTIGRDALVTSDGLVPPSNSGFVKVLVLDSLY